ncbi:MAG: two-component system, OmpR family, response regulator [Sphingomonadales bacterium]|jgi:DNA-binding response OmpR family regulator|nr:two-component system, OmpR family, response regulator [Sphingomonadales bacterium]
MSDALRILLVEDDPALAREIVRGLERDRWAVDHVACLADAFEAILQKAYRAILLDRRLPDGDGIALVAAAKSRPSAPPIIFLTARDEIADRVEGLDAGADDYLVKPFALTELLARLRAACRRPISGKGQPPVEIGRLTFDPATREARVGGKPLSLPRRELALLELLVRRAGRVVQRDYLESELYGLDCEVSANALETQISRLRRRLHDSGAELRLTTIRGVGYLLRRC